MKGLITPVLYRLGESIRANAGIARLHLYRSGCAACIRSAVWLSYLIFRVWSRNFNKIINRYAHIVTGQFYGHTHNDEFQIFYNDENYPTNIAYVAPSMTPYHGLNPSFRIYTVSVSGEMLDHEFPFAVSTFSCIMCLSSTLRKEERKSWVK